MGALKGLKLNNNEIISLRTGVFDPLVELVDLELQGNRLATLPGNIFRNLGKLRKLGLIPQPHPFAVDGGILWFAKFGSTAFKPQFIVRIPKWNVFAYQ